MNLIKLAIKLIFCLLTFTICFHDDRLNASEVGQSSICKRIGRERHLISGRDFRYENFLQSISRPFTWDDS